jgi:hypothetical protein
MDAKEIDKLAGANATGPRVSLQDIEEAILGVFYQSGDHLLDNADMKTEFSDQMIYDNARTMTICMIMMKNGFMAIGHSTPASPENYNFDLGKKLAYDQAFKQLWPLMGFALRTKLHAGSKP